MNNVTVNESVLKNKAAVVLGKDKKYYLFYAGSTRSVRAMANIPGSWLIEEKNTVGMPLTKEHLLSVEILGRVEEANNLYLEQRERLLKPSKIATSVYPKTPEGCPPPMKHQIDAFGAAIDVFKTGKRGFANWSEMGTGKTRWAIDLMRHLIHKGVAVVIGQKITLYQWQEEIEKTWPIADVVILQKDEDGKRVKIEDQKKIIKSLLSKEERQYPLVILINWETVSRLLDAFLAMPKFNMLVADESSRAKNRNAQMTKATLRLSGHAEFKIAMSGTPMGNDPGDFFTQYMFLDQTIFGGSYWRFVRNFFRLGGWTGNDIVEINPERVIPFVQKLYSCSYRTTKATIADMPPKSYRQVRLDMEVEQSRIYNQIADALYAEEEVEDGRKATLSVASALAKIVRLQQITAGIFPITEYVGDGKASAYYSEDEEGQKYKLIESVKTQWVKEYIRETLETDEQAKIVIWTRFRPELKSVYQTLVGGKSSLGLTAEDIGFVSGSTPDKRREELRSAFNDRNNPMRVLICQIQAAAYGLNIPAADILIYHSGTFSYLDRAQSEDRGHRIGRERPYQIIDVICRNSVDVRIKRVVETKKSLSELLLTEGFDRTLEKAR